MSSLTSSFLHILLLAVVIAISEAQHCRLGALNDKCPADEEATWSYDIRLNNGPDEWATIDNYTTCNGTRQSPIDIITRDAIRNNTLGRLELKNFSKPLTKALIENKGYTIRVIPEDGVNRTLTIDGVTYQLKEIHFHFGCNSSDGSEHSFDGKKYAMEAHIVYARSDGKKYVVVAVLYKEDEGPWKRSNPALKELATDFHRVKYNQTKTQLSRILNLIYLIKSNPLSNYYLYEGSVSRPGCEEIVTHIILRDVLIGVEIQEFRKLFKSTAEKSGSGGCSMAGNIRPIQPLNERPVYYFS